MGRKARKFIAVNQQLKLSVPRLFEINQQT